MRPVTRLLRQCGGPKSARNAEQPATQFITAIGKLYEVESKAKGKSVSERQQLRDELSRPILTQIESLLMKYLHAITPGSLMGKALHYLSAQWPTLIRYVKNGAWPIGRVEMWRGDRRLGLSVAAPFVWRCPSSFTVVPFPHPAHRTGRADFPHPALFQNIKPSHSKGRCRAAVGVSVPMFRKGTVRSIGGTPFPACRAVASTRSAAVAPYSYRSASRFALQALG